MLNFHALNLIVGIVGQEGRLVQWCFLAEENGIRILVEGIQKRNRPRYTLVTQCKLHTATGCPFSNSC